MTNYYIDHDAYTSSLSGTLTFTNGSTTVTGSGTAFTSELSTGDYIKSDDATEGVEWYEVTGITSDTELTIDHAFYQNTHSSTAKKNSNDGLSAANAFSHIQQYMDVAQAGDVGYVRRGSGSVLTYTYSMNLGPSNDGSISSLIKIIGDDGTGWTGDVSDKPIVKCVNNCRVYSLNDYFWSFEDLEVRCESNYGFEIYGSHGTLLEDCNIIGIGDSSSDYVAYVHAIDYCMCRNCYFSHATSGYGTIRLRYGGFSKFEGCTFENLYRVFYSSDGTVCELKDCTFTNNSTDVYMSFSSIFRSKGCNVSNVGSTSIRCMSSLDLEDYSGVGVHKSYLYQGAVERDTTVKTGNADDSVKVTPNSNCADSEFGKIEAFEWKVAGVTAASHTATVQVRGSGWTSFPTADELYIEVEYYDEATGTSIATTKSTNTLSANDTWTSFSVTFTPAQAGDVYVRGYLKKYESGAVVYFNGEVSIT